MKRILALAALIFALCATCAQASRAPMGILSLVNKQNPLPEGYAPSDLVVADVTFREGVLYERTQMRRVAADALKRMFDAAAEDDCELIGVSAYRSFKTQTFIYNARLEAMGEEYVSLYIAKPGQSEHQTGLAIDLGAPNNIDLTERFAESDEYKWLLEHAADYGFILRYPKGAEKITGYAFEPWHFRYVGVAVARKVAASGLTYEEYLRSTRRTPFYPDMLILDMPE